MMTLSLGKRRAVNLPSRYCDADEVRRAVVRLNPPFTVHPRQGENFSVRKRVFLSVDGLSVECENEDELHFACKLVAMDHNRWQTHTDEDNLLQQNIAETERMEAEAKARMEAPLTEEDFLPEEIIKEEEDITVEEWGQLGYKWFRKEDVIYL